MPTQTTHRGAGAKKRSNHKRKLIRHQILNIYGTTRLAKLVALIRTQSRCAYCHKPLKLSETTLDHIIPVSKGGQTSDNNLTAACARCNRAKADNINEEGYRNEN